MSQGVLQGKITRYANNPEKLKELRDGKTEEQKQPYRNHLKTVQALIKRSAKVSLTYSEIGV